ncbi:hypothetical protein FA09DRAFT_153483 [Tilletiopsis washingtonensis]|uniref:Uncharacterized protein n=1 Tax=Tilletiopsis washingtonensis TaxID=58919 RepID=A0A316Z0D6_9BASI|nr:hypothetical protein FA09DRAFT_153483 [Tilletiopsis washingtonensis]PWN95197.1 hypothetical protein FA09DRAFT_153483 [Tilletiopsis washingtonensis]
MAGEEGIGWRARGLGLRCKGGSWCGGERRRGVKEVGAAGWKEGSERRLKGALTSRERQRRGSVLRCNGGAAGRASSVRQRATGSRRSRSTSAAPLCGCPWPRRPIASRCGDLSACSAQRGPSHADLGACLRRPSLHMQRAARSPPAARRSISTPFRVDSQTAARPSENHPRPCLLPRELRCAAPPSFLARGPGRGAACSRVSGVGGAAFAAPGSCGAGADGAPHQHAARSVRGCLSSAEGASQRRPERGKARPQRRREAVLRRVQVRLLRCCCATPFFCPRSPQQAHL